MAGVSTYLKERSFTRIGAWSRVELETLLELAYELNAELARRPELRVQPGRTIGLIFHQPATRTRVAFEAWPLPPCRRAPARPRRVGTRRWQALADTMTLRQRFGTAAGLKAANVGARKREAVRGAHTVYTDAWTSMGQEDSRERMLHDLEPYRVDAGLLALAADDAVLLHRLPAHVGEEITADIFYGRRCPAWQQAGNRLHTQEALSALVIR